MVLCLYPFFMEMFILFTDQNLIVLVGAFIDAKE